MKKKLLKLLNDIFAPKVTYYYNDKKVSKLPKDVEQRMKELDKEFNEAVRQMKKVLENVRL